MKLYVFPIAPGPTKVRLYLAEKTAGGAIIDLPQVPVNLREGEQRGPAHLVRNPFGKRRFLSLMMDPISSSRSLSSSTLRNVTRIHR
jgi:hypothetical protein